MKTYELVFSAKVGPIKFLTFKHRHKNDKAAIKAADEKIVEGYFLIGITHKGKWVHTS